MKKLSQSRGFLMIFLFWDGFELHHVRDSFSVKRMSKAIEALDIDVWITQYVLCGEGTASIHQFPTMGYTSLRVNIQLVFSI